MDLQNIPVMQAIGQKLGWLTENQKVIAQNVANANTPGYMARELKAMDFSRLLASALGGGRAVAPTVLKSTNPKHFSAPGQTGPNPFQIVEAKDVLEVTPTGNSVVLEEQMLALTNTQMEYGLMVNLYRKQVGLLKIALGRSR